jgi:hypothetical protein
MLHILTRWFRDADSPPSLGPNVFPEEPLTRSAEDGFGFFPASPGLQVKDGRYEVLRKLGRGQHSSTWLVLDSQYVHLSSCPKWNCNIGLLLQQ